MEVNLDGSKVQVLYVLTLLTVKRGKKRDFCCPLVAQGLDCP